MMMYTRNKVKRIVGFIVFGSLFVVVVGYLVMLLWNALIPDIFSVQEITFWQALGLLLLARILFGGFGPKGYRRHHGWRNKWMSMSPEQKAELRKKWKEHCEKKESRDSNQKSEPE